MYWGFTIQTCNADCGRLVTSETHLGGGGREKLEGEPEPIAVLQDPVGDLHTGAGRKSAGPEKNIGEKLERGSENTQWPSSRTNCCQK